MALYFVGLGLCGVKGIALEGIEAVRKCSEVYVELYTSLVPGLQLSELQNLLGVEVRQVSRREVEGRWSEEVIERARETDIALLTPGDPFIATTHVALRLEALRRGVEVKVVHAASTATAIPGLTGLSFYKFGRSATVVYPEPGYVPHTAYDVVKENLERGLHTLLFLDSRAEEGVYMTAPDAIRVLLSLEQERREGVLAEETLVVAVARAGCSDAKVWAGRAERAAEAELGPPPHSLVVPGLLHFVEREALMLVAGASKEELDLHEKRVSRLLRSSTAREGS